MKSLTPLTQSPEPSLDDTIINPSNLVLQQRQILQMMGLDIWIKRDSNTVFVDYKNHNQISNSSDTDIPTLDKPSNKTQQSNELSQTSNEKNSLSTENKKTLKENNFNAEIANNDFNNNTKLDNKHLADETTYEISDSSLSESKRSQVAQSLQDKVDAFELLGARYKNWVIMIDTQILQNHDVAILWQNLVEALSLIPERLHFPICEGINDYESANASVAGFIFRLAKSNKLPLALLSPMPAGIDHKMLVRVPYLTEMLSDSRQKKQLWQLLNGNNV